MSFSSETKKALCASFIKKDCCARALLFGLLRFSGMPLADGVNRLHSKQGDVLHLGDSVMDRRPKNREIWVGGRLPGRHAQAAKRIFCAVFF